MIYPSDEAGYARGGTLRAGTGGGGRPRASAVSLVLVAVMSVFGFAHSLPAQEGDAATGEEHRVRPGDTLWDLADRYLQDPFAWEELYRVNREFVPDPDRIFPGQLLRIPTSLAVASRENAPGTVAASDTAAEIDAPAGEPRVAGAGEEPAAQASSFQGPTVFDEAASDGGVTTSLSVEAVEPSPLVSPSDVYRAPWMGPRRLEPDASVARVLRGGTLGLELPPTVAATDRVVLALEAPGVEVGSRLQALRSGLTFGEDGRIYHPVGLIEVTGIEGDSARATVDVLYGRFEVGTPLVAVPDLPDPRAVRTVPAEDSLVTRVTALERDDHLVVGESMVFLEVSDPASIRQGEEFALYPPEVSEPAVRHPEDRAGVVRVVRVTTRGATARVVQLNDVGAGVGSPAVRIRRPAQ
jgi:LysM repeat protein